MQNIHLLSCRSREMRTDLLPLFYELTTKEDRIVHTFIRDTEQNTSYRSISPDILGRSENADSVCNDLAMRKFLPPLSRKQKQILLVTMNNYYFQMALRTEPFGKDDQKDRLSKFSHIFVPNQFVYDLLQKNFIIKRNQKIHILQNPFIWNLNQAHLANEHLNSFLRFFPSAKGKKILFLMLTNEISDSSRHKLSRLSLKLLLEQMGDQWMIVTNSLPVLEQTKDLDLKLAERVLYIKRQYPLEDILYFSDMVVTNLSFFAAAQAGRNKPFYCIKHNGNPFEKFIEINHPAMFLSSPDDLMNVDYSVSVLTPAQRKFYEIFTSIAASDPAATICQLL